MMPGEIDRVIGHPSSFYGSRKSKSGYCTRRTISHQQNGSESRLIASSSKLMNGMNGGKLGHSQLAFGSTNTIPASAHQSSSVLAPRHCRYFNMHVHHLPRKQSASRTTHGVNGCSSLYQSSSPAARRPNVSAAAASAVVDRPLASSRESRVLISAELKSKADTEMMNVRVSADQSGDSERDDCSSRSDSSVRKKVQRTDEVKKTDRAGLTRFSGKGLKLRNGRSLPDCREVKKEKAVTGQQHGGNRFDVKVKKCRMKYRSRSLSPTKPLALARPRRTAVTKKSVSDEFIDIHASIYVMFSVWFTT